MRMLGILNETYHNVGRQEEALRQSGLTHLKTLPRRFGREEDWSRAFPKRGLGDVVILSEEDEPDQIENMTRSERASFFQEACVFAENYTDFFTIHAKKLEKLQFGEPHEINTPWNRAKELAHHDSCLHSG